MRYAAFNDKAKRVALNFCQTDTMALQPCSCVLRTSFPSSHHSYSLSLHHSWWSFPLQAGQLSPMQTNCAILQSAAISGFGQLATLCSFSMNKYILSLSLAVFLKDKRPTSVASLHLPHLFSSTVARSWTPKECHKRAELRQEFHVSIRRALLAAS